jgi:mono/diheme cytochrome c family protein
VPTVLLRSLFVTLLCFLTPAYAQHDAFPFGDPNAGAKLFEAKCAACHIQRFGNISKAFVRPDRKAKDAASLLAWVQRCNNGNGFGLGREEEESLAAYLNESFYKFK